MPNHCCVRTLAWQALSDGATDVTYVLQADESLRPFLEPLVRSFLLGMSAACALETVHVAAQVSRRPAVDIRLLCISVIPLRYSRGSGQACRSECVALSHCSALPLVIAAACCKCMSCLDSRSGLCYGGSSKHFSGGRTV